MLIKAAQFNKTAWSGGTTAELFIYPETSSYVNRDFEVRISTATVEAERSDFTSLPGYSRKLMVLEGDITISHLGHYTKSLKKFDVDTFDGSWKTTSVGKCTDFNLMTKQGIVGSLNSKPLNKGESITYNVKNSASHCFIYLYKGSVEITEDNNKTELFAGDLYIILPQNTNSFIIQPSLSSEMIVCEVVI